MHLFKNPSKGFTLAELLIALAILGVIATFTIPKVLIAQTNAQNNANAHEAASMVAAAYQQALLSGTWTTNTNGSTLSQYMNYLGVLPTIMQLIKHQALGVQLVLIMASVFNCIMVGFYTLETMRKWEALQRLTEFLYILIQMAYTQAVQRIARVKVLLLYSFIMAK